MSVFLKKKKCIGCFAQIQSYGKDKKTYEKSLGAEEKKNINEQRGDTARKNVSFPEKFPGL